MNKGRRWKGSRLTLRILAVNMVAPLVLVLGVLYMSQYRDSLIRAELETLKAQTMLFAGAIAEGAVKPVENGTPFLFASPGEIEAIAPELSRRMVRRLGETMQSRVRLFDAEGRMIGDSQHLSGPGGGVQITPLEPPGTKASIAAAIHHAAKKITDMIPAQSTLQTWPQTSSVMAHDYTDAAIAFQGRIGATAWKDDKGGIVLSAAAPVQRVKRVMGVVMLTRDGRSIDAAMSAVHFDVITVFLGALSVTIFLSIYLAGVIGRPLKRLSTAAEAIRHARNRQTVIPDMSRRQDEIGDLSLALRDMTQALWDRMDMIESFAADVSHELKNPLTSLRSAVETAARVTNDADRKKLMDIIQHDVRRLDRLISDISNASRLDAELSRDIMGEVDLRRLLEQLADLHRAPLDRGGGEKALPPTVILEIPQRRDVIVRGNESRLAQVFENLISNALSFSPPGSPVIVRVVLDKKMIRITVEDEGPGIPENKLETVFERFYSERPQHESYGNHSGLGLSIARQIVTAHGGKIYAENIHGRGGSVSGACFTVLLEAA